MSWRDGRPRFNPGPSLRRLVRGQDLRHGPRGPWFTAEECLDWLKAKHEEVEERRAARAQRRRPRVAGAYTMAHLFDDLWKSPRFAGARGGRQLSPATVYDYRNKAAALLAFAPELARRDVRTITKPDVLELHENLWTTKGLSMANGIVAVLRLALSYAERCGRIRSNPARELGLEAVPARLRVGTFAEMQALIRAADAIGESMVGTAILLGLMTGQRQGDRLALAEAGIVGGWLRFVQRKTGAIVEVPAAPVLVDRLTIAAAQRVAMRAIGEAIVVDHRTRQAFTQDAYGKRFAKVRAHAATACPSLADFTDQDLRDTAVTWLANAGASIPQIRAITGHSLESVTTILKHYLAVDREQAAGAIVKLVAYLEHQAPALNARGTAST